MTYANDRFWTLCRTCRNSPYAQRGLGRRCLPKPSFFSTRRGRSPRLVEKRRNLGGLAALQTARRNATCVRWVTISTWNLCVRCIV